VFVTDHAEEVLKCELVSVTGPFPVGAERSVMHQAQLFKYGAAIAKTAQVTYKSIKIPDFKGNWSLYRF